VTPVEISKASAPVLSVSAPTPHRHLELPKANAALELRLTKKAFGFCIPCSPTVEPTDRRQNGVQVVPT